jgi:hypothetical protein
MAAGVAQLAYGARHGGAGHVGRPAGLTGDLAGLHRHERALVRPHLVHERQQVWPRVAFDVVLDPIAKRREQRSDLANVAAGDVAFVRPRMHGDARGALRNDHAHGLENGRLGAAA